MGDVMDEIYDEEEMISLHKGFLPERGRARVGYSFILVTAKPEVVADLPYCSANLPSTVSFCKEVWRPLIV